MTERLNTPRFSYATAFSRNLGWTTEWEQEALRAKRVAVAGMGGVGGSHLLTLVRMGVGQFHIADFDQFDMVNLNRQAGASMATLGLPKVDVLAEMALAINPELKVVRFGAGVTADNLDQFLSGCDLFVDGLDFFALDMRSHVFARCAELGIPAVTAAPIGMGVGFLAFLPGGMTFEQYFRLEGQADPERYLRFLLGVAPGGLHRSYLADDTRVDIAAKRGPSTAAACELCAGMVATQALKLLLGRGDVPHAPVHLHFDAYRGILARTRLRWGNAGPIQRLKLAVGRRVYQAMAMRQALQVNAPPPSCPLLAILDLARWAPSGDNTQPWRFELVDSETLIVHFVSSATTNPYEYRDGEPTLLSCGMMLESIRVAASLHGRSMCWSVEPGGPPWRSRVHLPISDEIVPSLLAAALPMRSVVRGALSTLPLKLSEKAALQNALGPGLRISWHEGLRDRMRFAALGRMATDIRLRLPETFEIHNSIVDWERDRSPDGLPARAIGLNQPTLMLMRWAMQRWSRMQRVNTLLGTSAAALQLDIWPALASSSFFVVRTEPTSLNNGAVDQDRVMCALQTGERLQRFWLTATQLGLAIQPTLAILAFADHGIRGTAFTQDEQLRGRARLLGERASSALGELGVVRFIGRIGKRRHGLPGPRSVRKSLQDLMWQPPSALGESGSAIG